MGQVYVLRLRNKKWYVGYTERGSIDRILEHIEKKGAKWTKKYPPLKNGYLHSVSKPGATKKDEDKETLALMSKYGISNVRGGQWCMVFMPKEIYTKLSIKISKRSANKVAPVKKKSPVKKKAPVKKNVKDVICAKCNRVGHESKDCYAKFRVQETGPLSNLLRKGLKKK
jgi:hypothetical protein